VRQLVHDTWAFFLFKMLSYQKQYQLAQSLTSDDDSTNLTMLQSFIKIGNRKLQARLGLYISEKQRTFTMYDDAITGTSGLAYYLPENFKSLTEFYTTIGTLQHPAEQIQDPGFWRELSRNTTGSTSSFPQFVFIKNDRIEVSPLPTSSDTNTATLRYESVQKDLSAADYTTGTITTLANGSTAITGSGTTWTTNMVGRYFKITNDEQWYKIGTFTSTTSISLERDYQGVSIAAGTDSYTIGQMAELPPTTYELPVYYAVWKWALFRKDTQLAREYERMWKEGVRDAIRDWGNTSSSDIIRDVGGRRGLINPNNYPGTIT